MLLIFFIFFFAIVFPGYIFYLKIKQHLNFEESYSTVLFFSINLGLFINVILFLILSVTKIKLNVLYFLYPILFISLLGFHLKKIKAHIENLKIKKEEWFLLLILLLSFIILLFKKGEIPIDINYLVPVSRSLDEGYLVNKQFVFTSEIFDPRFSFNPYCYIILLIKLFSNYSLIYIWRNIPFIWVFCSLISLYSFSNIYFNNQKVGLYVILIFFLHFGGVFFNMIGFTTFSKPLPVHLYVYIPFLWLIVMKFFKNNNFILYLVLFTAFTNLISYNPFYLILALFSLFPLFVYETIYRPQDTIKKTHKILFIFLLCFPFLIFKLIIFSSSNPGFYDLVFVNTSYSFRNVIIFLSKNAYILNPYYLFRVDYSLNSYSYFAYPISSIIALFITPFFFFSKEWKKIEIRLLLLCIFFIIFIAENPILFPLLSKFISLIYAQAIGIIIPHFIITGYACYLIFNYIGKKFKKSKNIILLLSLLVIFLWSFNHIKNNYHVLKNDFVNREKLYELPEPINYIKSMGIENKMFFSDPTLNDFICSFSNNFVFYVYSTDSNPNDPFSVERENKFNAIIKENNIDIIKSFFFINNIDFLVITKNYPSKEKLNLINLEQIYFCKKEYNMFPLYLKIKENDLFPIEWEDENYIMFKISQN
ncbi:hypothetical protein KAU33_12410 [Candidatus Dependentiae bacterium]|nr:hypothetical protein [Candidatus Dependentiae bacterium]